MLHHQYTELLLKYTKEEQNIRQLWKEIEAAYGDSDRHFHNLAHLQQLYTALLPVQPLIQDWDCLLLALFYHDIAYDVVQYVLENNNEERSAAIAEKTLTALGYPAEKILRCQQHILATKTHQLTENADTNFFIDADLSILGQPWDVYHAYIKNIRKEYAIYPDPIYHAGRMKVLQHFLDMERVYKTDHFHQEFEQPARENMEREIEILSTMV